MGGENLHAGNSSPQKCYCRNAHSGQRPAHVNPKYRQLFPRIGVWIHIGAAHQFPLQHLHSGYHHDNETDNRDRQLEVADRSSGRERTGTGQCKIRRDTGPGLRTVGRSLRGERKFHVMENLDIPKYPEKNQPNYERPAENGTSHNARQSFACSHPE